MPATLRTGTALYASALLVDRLLGLLLLPLLTRAVAPGDYGAWTQTAVTAGILMPVVLLATPTAIVRSFSGAGSAPIHWRFFGRLGIVAALVFGIVTAAVLTWREPFSMLVWGDAGRESLVPALLALLAADAAVDFALAWLRAAGRMALISAAMALRSASRFGVVLWLVRDGAAIGDWLASYAAAQCLLAATVAGLTMALLRRHAGDRSTPPVAAVPRTSELLAFSLPLVAMAIFTAFSASFDRFLLVRLLGLDAVAVYAAAVSLSGVPALFYTVLGFTLFPVLSRHWAAGRRDVAARLTTVSLQAYAFLCVPVAMALAITGPSLLPLLSTANYRADPAVFALLGVAVAAFGLYQILLYPLLLDGRSAQVMVLALVAAAINAAANLLLAPRYGMVGAAAAAAAAPAAMVIAAAAITRRLMPWRFPWRALAAIAARAVVGVLPLALLVFVAGAGPGPSAGVPWPAAVAALVAGAAAYLILDWRSPASVARMLMPK